MIQVIESCSAHSVRAEGGVTFCNEILKTSFKRWLFYMLNKNLQMMAKSQLKLSFIRKMASDVSQLNAQTNYNKRKSVVMGFLVPRKSLE